jgi:hypothetical protein
MRTRSCGLLIDARSSLGAALTHVGEDQIFQTNRLDRPERIDDGAVGTNEQRALALRVARFDDDLALGECRVARANESMVSGEEIFNLAGHLDPRGDQDDEIVAHSLDVGDEMRRQQYAHVMIGNRLHQDLEKLTSRERIETSDGLVEQEKVGSLGNGEREGELRALTSRQLSRALTEVEPELLNSTTREFVVPLRIDVLSIAKMVANTEA